MVTKKKIIKRKYPVVLTPHFRSKAIHTNLSDFRKIKKCLKEIPSRPTKGSMGIKSCENIRVVYKVSNSKIYPLTFIKKKGKNGR